MKRSFTASTQLAFLMASVAIGALAYQGDTPALSTAPRLKHAPVQVRRNEDGTIKRGRNAEILTSNWSGYAVAQFETGQTYTAAQATWTVPTLTFEAHDNDHRSLRTQYSATWVGIGGFCEDANCFTGDSTLIQLGTEQQVTANGSTYFSWYEVLPNSPVNMSTKTFPVVAGDQITASLQCNAPCVGNPQTWTLSMTSTNASWPKTGWTVTLSYASSRLSAEWIEEAPSSRAGILPLANFGTVAIDPDLGGEPAPGALTQATNGILMETPWGQTANVSDPNAASSNFNVCWGFLALTGCSPP